MVVHLVPIGGARHELYAEHAAADDGPLPHDAGRVRRWLHRAGEQWRAYVDAARMGTATGIVARWRDAVICKLATAMDEQRTLRALRTASAAMLLYPEGLDPSAARAMLDRLLAASRRHHGRQLAVYLVLFVLSGILFFVPGPNIVAYYLGFQAFGHLQAWRGARHAAGDVRWTLTPSADLAALASAPGERRDDWIARVHEVAIRLGLEHLPAFVERAAH